MTDQPDAQQPDPDHAFPRIEVSTLDVAELAGLLIGAQEYLEALNRVAMFEGRQRPLCYLVLARDVLVQWTRENVVRARDCTCPSVMTRMTGCVVHDPAAGAKS